MMKLSSRDDDDGRRLTFEAAFHALFEGQFASLFRYLNRLTGDADLADDLAQEVFVRLYQRGSMPDDSRGWMAAVANNLLRDDSRTAKRRLRLLASQPAELTLATPPSEADEKTLADEKRLSVRVALDKLSDRDRQLLLLRHEGYSYREIAHATGVSETSVGTLLIRATSAFKAAFSGIGS